MSRHFLAVCLWIFAACTLAGILPVALLAARSRDRLMTAVAIVLGLLIAAVLATAGADLW